MKAHRVLYIGAVFRMSHWSDIWNRDLFILRGDSYSIRELKMPSIKYSKRMLESASAVDMYLIKRAELHKKYEVVKIHLPAFNYVVPEPDR